MSERDIFQVLIEARREGKSVILATIVRAQGSVPRHAGAKMLIFEDGDFIGTIGGGEMESRVLSEAPEVLASGSPTTLHYELAEPSRGDPGVCGGQVDIFLEPIMPDPTVLVIGCGHIGQALAELAHWLGFRVIVSDDREELCSPDVIPDADEYLVIAPEEIAHKATIHRRTYVAAVTRGVPFDLALLPSLLETEAPYIGVIGSRRRWATSAGKLAAAGVDEATLQRVHAPIGLELQAETPREIALSIMAEIIAQQHGGTGKSMKWMGSPEDAGGVVS